MHIQKSTHRFRRATTSSLPQPKISKPKEKKGDFWDELFGGELQEIGVYLSPENIQTTVEGARALGESLRKTWSGLRERVTGLFDLDKDASTFDSEFREKAADVVVGTAKTIGFAAAGVQGIGGLYKLGVGIRDKDLGKTIGSVFDLSTAAAVATTVAGLAVGPLVLSPLAAGLGVVRGGYGAVKGFLTGNGRQEIQGALDATRSASVGLKLAGGISTGLATAGAVLGPIAGLIQFSRGHYDLSHGLQTENKAKQWQGLTDIASAAGLTLALTGVGTIPGIAVTSLSLGSRLLYQFNDKFEDYANQKLEANRPTLAKSVEVVDKISQPVILAGRAAIEWVFGTKRGEDG